MIVICTKCEAKFRVADDRVGPRGANVRCSKCRNVFFLYPPPAGAAAAPVGAAAPAAPAEPPPGAEAGGDNPFAASPVRAPGARPPPLPPPLPSFGASAATPAADPFAALASAPAPLAPSADPFAAAAAIPPSDPFAAAPAPDPFASAAASTAAPFAAAAPPPAEIPEAHTADLLAGAAGAEASPLEVETGGLALEERRTPQAFRAPGVGPDAAQAGDAAALEGAQEEPSLRLATEVTAAPGEPLAAASAERAAPERPAASAAPAPAEPETRIPGARASRVRAAIVNALALAALLAAVLALVVVSRTDGPLDPAALRPSALLARLRGADEGGPFAARAVRSGLYERARGPPLLFVRGEVLSRAPAPVRRVRVAVEVVRDGRVLARGEALAGAVPTPEALHRAADAAALAEAGREAARAAPERIAPGDAVPFLVAIAEHPGDLEGASLRVEATAADDAP